MQTATASPDVTQAAPLPPADKPAIGAGNPEHLPALPGDLLAMNEEMSRKLASIETLGRQVNAKGADVSKQETHCAKIKANLDEEREKLHKLERERDELQEELTMLATGKASERLPFPAPEASNESKAAGAAPASADAWKSVTLEMLGIKTKRVLAALHDHEPPIVTHGDLAAWQQKKGDFWAKDIKKLGDKGREEIENAQQAYWLANPQAKAAEPAAANAGSFDDDFDDAVILSETILTIVNNTRHPVIFQVEVAQRKSGRWANRYTCSIAGAKKVAAVNTKGFFDGHHASKAEATVAAVDACDTFAKTVLNGKPSKKVREAAKEIRRIIDRIDKQVAAESPEAARAVNEGLADPKSQADADVKNTEKDQTAKRAREGK